MNDATPRSDRAPLPARAPKNRLWSKWLLIFIALGFCFVFLLLPLLNVFAQALPAWVYYGRPWQSRIPWRPFG